MNKKYQQQRSQAMAFKAAPLIKNTLDRLKEPGIDDAKLKEIIEDVLGEVLSDACNKLLTNKEASSYLGLKPNTLESWRLKGTGPKFCKIGRGVRYRVSDLVKFIEASVRTSTSDQGAS